MQTYHWARWVLTKFGTPGAEPQEAITVKKEIIDWLFFWKLIKNMPWHINMLMAKLTLHMFGMIYKFWFEQSTSFRNFVRGRIHLKYQPFMFKPSKSCPGLSCMFNTGSKGVKNQQRNKPCHSKQIAGNSNSSKHAHDTQPEPSKAKIKNTP